MKEIIPPFNDARKFDLDIVQYVLRVGFTFRDRIPIVIAPLVAAYLYRQRLEGE